MSEFHSRHYPHSPEWKLDKLLYVQEKIMDELVTLTADIATLKQDVADSTAANAAAFARLQAIIDGLKNTPPAGIDPAALVSLIADVEGASAALKAETAVANTEAPAPAPAPVAPPAA